MPLFNPACRSAARKITRWRPPPRRRRGSAHSLRVADDAVVDPGPSASVRTAAKCQTAISPALLEVDTVYFGVHLASSVIAESSFNIQLSWTWTFLLTCS